MGPLGVYLRGVCMGAADAVPGVSGGTIALITGIYDRFVAALTAIDPERIRTVLGDLLRGDLRGVHETLVRMDAYFLVALGLGVVSAVLVVSRVVDVALESVPGPTFAFFFGLIAASAVVLADEVHLDAPGRIIAAVAGFSAAFLVSGATASAIGSGPLVLFVTGAIAISAMVLPGISGSLLLLLLGQYEYLVGTLHDFVDALTGLADGGSVAPVVDHGTVVAIFVAGALVGLFTVAHVIRFALERRREATLAFLVSLIVGALRAPGERILDATGTWDAAAVGVVGAAAVAGAAVVFVFDRYAGVTY